MEMAQIAKISQVRRKIFYEIVIRVKNRNQGSRKLFMGHPFNMEENAIVDADSYGFYKQSPIRKRKKWLFKAILCPDVVACFIYDKTVKDFAIREEFKKCLEQLGLESLEQVRIDFYFKN